VLAWPGLAATLVAFAQVAGAALLGAPVRANDVEAADVLGLTFEDALLIGDLGWGGELDGAAGERGRQGGEDRPPDRGPSADRNVSAGAHRTKS